VLSRWTQTPLHLHVQDVVPDIAVESGQLRSPLARRAAIRLARWTYGSYRSISVLGAGMRRRLGAYVRFGTDVSIIPNWVRAGRAGATSRSPRVPFEKYAVYAGSLGEKQGVECLSVIEALSSWGTGPVGPAFATGLVSCVWGWWMRRSTTPSSATR
jgi:hypothetical protein